MKPNADPHPIEDPEFLIDDLDEDEPVLNVGHLPQVAETSVAEANIAGLSRARRISAHPPPSAEFWYK